MASQRKKARGAAAHQGEDVRERILAEARDLYLESGFEGLSMRALARRVGVSPGALYWHFENREALVGAIFLQGVEAFYERMSTTPTGTPEESLTIYAEAFLQFGLDQPQDFEVFFLKRPPDIGQDAWTIFDEKRARSFEDLLARMQAAEQAGLLVGDPDEAALSLMTSAVGLMSLYFAGQFDMNRARFSELFRRTIGAQIARLKP